MNDYVKKRINELASEKHRKFSSGLIPGVNNILGVPMPKMRELAKEISKMDAETVENYLKTATNDSFEEISLQGMVICLMRGKFDKSSSHVALYIPKITNWAICDTFCCGLKNMAKYKSKTWEFIQPYFGSDKEFEIRFALVMSLAHFVDENHIDEILVTTDKTKHEGYYVKMAAAWLLSVCFVKFPDKTMSYLKNNSLDDFTYNKSLQKIIESNRVDAETKIIIKTLKRKTKNA